MNEDHILPRASTRARLRKDRSNRRDRHEQRGGILVLAGASLLTLAAFGALAIEVGNLMLARTQLQNVADAAAMAGAGCLLARNECGNVGTNGTDWQTARQRALDFVPSNPLQGKPVSDVVVDAGFWNMYGSPATLQPNSIVPGDYDYPAIRVTVSATGNAAGTGYQAPLVALLGSAGVSVNASAVAVLSHPGTTTAGTVFPLVIAKCMYDTYWNASTGSPVLATAVTMPGFDLPQVVGEPLRFKITSSYKAGACESGQWSSLDLDSSSAAVLRGMLQSGNTTAISLGQTVWVQPGAQTTLYSDVQNCSDSGNKSCAWVMIPVVQTVNSHTATPVMGFACVRVLSAVGGSGKYIAVQMSADATRCPRSGSGIGPNYGITTPARLVN